MRCDSPLLVGGRGFSLHQRWDLLVGLRLTPLGFLLLHGGQQRLRRLLANDDLFLVACQVLRRGIVLCLSLANVVPARVLLEILVAWRVN